MPKRHRCAKSVSASNRGNYFKSVEKLELDGVSSIDDLGESQDMSFYRIEISKTPLAADDP